MTTPNAKGEHLVIALPAPEPTEITAALRSKYPGLTVDYHALDQVVWNYDQLPDDIWKSATIIQTLAALPSSPDVVPNLRFIHTSSSGTNHLQKSPFFQDPKIKFTNSSGASAVSIAEWVILMILAHTRFYSKTIAGIANKQWDKSLTPFAMQNVDDNADKRIGILGYGSIGRQVANVAKSLGMQAIAYTQSPRRTPESKRDNGYITSNTGDPEGSAPVEWYNSQDDGLHAFLGANLDYLLVCAPLTDETRGLLGDKEFEILGRKKTYVLNVGRGEIIKTDALVKALHAYKSSDGREGICGAALDVVDPEPLPSDHPVWDAPNVTITPHISGVYKRYISEALHILDINIGRHLEGKPLLNEVDKTRI